MAETPKSRKVITAYGGGGFRVSGERLEGSIVVLPDRVLTWPVTALEQVTPTFFDDLIDSIEVLLVGCGARFDVSPTATHEIMARLGIAIDVMDTGAACRTYNVLVAEDRRVAAALIAIA